MIRLAYYKPEYKTRYRWFRSPTDIHWVRFSVRQIDKGDTYSVGIYNWPKALPPIKQVKDGHYEYSPTPLDPDVPISSTEFLHFLSDHPSSSSLGRKFLPRFPKKKKESAKLTRHDELEFHWGLRVIEGPNYDLFNAIVSVTAILCIVVGCIVGAALKSAFQGFSGAGTAFAILYASLNFVYTTIKDAGERDKGKTS